MKKQTFEDFLQDKFMEEREIGGRPINKDNYEDLFERFLELDSDTWIAYGQEYAVKIALETKEEVIKAFEPMVALLQEIKGTVENIDDKVERQLPTYE